MKKYSERLDIYSMDFTYIDTSNVDKVLEKYGIEFNGVGGVAQIPGDAIYILINTKHEEWKLDIFAHECVHAANEVYNALHIEHDINNDEPFAYLVSWIFAQGYYKLIKKK